MNQIHWLAEAGDSLRKDSIQRFDPKFWTVNFPRPMMAAITTPQADQARVHLSFYEAGNLAGLIWESADRFDHALTGYATNRDYRGLVWQFRWQSLGSVLPLDVLNGPTLTIEGRDEGGAPRTWYVRLWNYADGDPDDAQITVDFDALDGGFLLPSEADPVWAGDIDRLFISMAPPGYVQGSTAPLASAPLHGEVLLSGITVDGAGSVLAIGDPMTPPHRLRMATGYDDQYHLAPARVLRACIQLGYRGWINHYVGMSHYFALVRDVAGNRWLVDPTGMIDSACAAWHAEFLRLADDLGFTVVLSLSFEVLDAHAPDSWKQRDHGGSPALTGWSPPSTLLSPCSAPAVAYLKAVAAAFLAFVPAGAPRWFQIGEPWWWSGLGGARRPYIYDAATTAAYPAETGQAVPSPMTAFPASPGAAQLAYVDWCAGKLAAATLALRDHVRTQAPGTSVAILLYTPQIFDAASPVPARLNLPAGWVAPAFDVLQLEDYDHVTAGDWSRHRDGLDAMGQLLAYPPGQSQYFAGFVLTAGNPESWHRIGAAIASAAERDFAETFIWAWPQVMRDGFTFAELPVEQDMTDFHDVLFPLEIGYGSSGGPQFSTTIISMASGHEQRLVEWAEPKMRYDVGLGVRSETDLVAVQNFFHARRGQAYAFRFRDPLDQTSSQDAAITPQDQLLGSGDGVTTDFALVKGYGSGDAITRRRIVLPVPGTVRIALDGVELTSGWAWHDAERVVRFDAPPAAGVAITAGYRFDVPVRFAEDKLEISQETWRAAGLVSIPLVECRIGSL